jgi:hypothetical protein
VFSSVFTVFLLQKHVLFVHFTCIQKTTCFLLWFYCRNMYFLYISHVYTKIHMNHIFYMKCTVLLVFSCVFTVILLQKHVILVHVTCIYQNTHVPIILHEIHSFASIFMCFHCVFTAKTNTFGTFYMYIPKYTCTIYSA